MAKHGDSKQLAASARKARARNLRLIRFFVSVIVIVAVFCLGFFVRGNAAVLSALGFTALVGDDSATAADQRTVYNSLSERVGEVEETLSDESLDSFDLDQTTSGVLNALAQATEDPYLRYYDQAQYALLEQNAGDDYEGVGVLFGESGGVAYAVDVFDESPAQIAGVQQGDFVVAIDGDRGREWSQAEVLAALDREEGSTVVITWRRPTTNGAEGGEEFTTALTCSKTSETNVESVLGDGGVGVVTLRQITSNSADLVRSAVESLEAQGARSYVLDIRNVPGGYLSQAVEIANLFVRNGIIVQIQTNSGISTRQASGEVVTDKPLTVLVNENTSAAAEVLASALQDNQRATLVGHTTMGKGSVQVVRELSFGGALRYTAAFYLSPQGRSIDGLGVVPDIVVDRSDGASDNQLSLAIETAQSSIAG